MLGFEEAGRIEPGALADLALFDVMKLEYTGAHSDRSRPSSSPAATTGWIIYWSTESSRCVPGGSP